MDSDTPKGRSLSLPQESEFSIYTYGDFTIWRCIIIFNSLVLPPPHSSPLAYQLSLYAVRGEKYWIAFYIFPLSPQVFPSCAHFFFLYLLQPPQRLIYSQLTYSLFWIFLLYQIIPIKIQKGFYLLHLNKGNNKWQNINRNKINPSPKPISTFCIFPISQTTFKTELPEIVLSIKISPILQFHSSLILLKSGFAQCICMFFSL